MRGASQTWQVTSCWRASPQQRRRSNLPAVLSQPIATFSRLRNSALTMQRCAAVAQRSPQQIEEQQQPDGGDVPQRQEAAAAIGADLDWRNQWYPVAFAQDLPEGRLTRFSLFDETIVVVRRPTVTHADGTISGGPVAMADRCPHRAAALSEGLLTPDGLVQCAYHGWKLDAVTGACREIPQLPPGAKFSGKTSGVAFPALEHQGLVWIRANGDAAEYAAAANSAAELPELPELNREGWTSDDYVRDFPIDYSLLMENLMDPDHGLFAHQMTGFDAYAADATHPMKVETGERGSRPTITGTTAGVMKLTKKPETGKDRGKPGANDPSGLHQKLLTKLFGKKRKKGEEPTAERAPLPGSAPAPPHLRSTIHFEAPGFVRWSRFTPEGDTSFIAAFHVAPLGVGRTRLLIRYCRNAAPWLHPPRWAFCWAVNRFVDQDSHLLATQQPVTLGAELQAHLAAAQHSSSGSDGSSSGGGGEAAGSPQGAPGDAELFPPQRRRLFAYRSPSEGLLISLGRFIDAAVPRMPNRARLLLAAHAAGGGLPGAIPEPRREEVLDRWAGHTAICPDSAAAHARFRAAAAVFAFFAAAGVVALLHVALVDAVVTSVTSVFAVWSSRAWGGVLATVASAAAAALCHKATRIFHYCYTPDLRDRDLAKIPKLTSHLNNAPAGAAA